LRRARYGSLAGPLTAPAVGSRVRQRPEDLGRAFVAHGLHMIAHGPRWRRLPRTVARCGRMNIRVH
jgi:hypothetical protein